MPSEIGFNPNWFPPPSATGRSGSTGGGRGRRGSGGGNAAPFSAPRESYDDARLRTHDRNCVLKVSARGGRLLLRGRSRLSLRRGHLPLCAEAAPAAQPRRLRIFREHGCAEREREQRSDESFHGLSPFDIYSL